MSTLVTRFDLVDSAVSEGAHVTGETVRDVPAGEPARVALVDDMDAAHAAIARGLKVRQARGVRGPVGKPYVSVVIAGPPTYGSTNDWSLEDELAWSRDVVAWVRAVMPSATVARAIAHRDKTVPHMHIQLVPTMPDGLVSWRQLQRETCADLGRDPDRRGEPLVALRDSLHETVNEPWGLGHR